MSDQLSDAQNSGFDPYAHAAAKRESEQGREIAQAAAEAEIVTQLTGRIAAKIGEADATGDATYREMAVAALAVAAPLLADRDAAVARLRDHMLAEADRLGKQHGRQLSAEHVAATLRGIVEATR